MRKAMVILSFASFILVNESFAQFGVKGGIVLYGSSQSTDNNVFFVGGVTYHHQLSKKFFFQGEFLLDNYKYTVGNGIESRIRTLSMPALLGFNLTKKVSVYAGPQVELALTRNKGVLFDPVTSYYSGVNESTYHFFVRMSLGCSYRINERLSMDVRYIHIPSSENIQITTGWKFKTYIRKQ